MNELLSKGSVVDVRTPGEYHQGHYPGAINIPLHEVPKRIHEIKNLEQPIVVYCLSGNRSGMAMILMKQSGVTEVYNGGSITDLLQLNK